MRLLLAACLAAPLPALADTYRCPTAGYCTNDLECFPDTAVFQIVTDKSGGATFGWQDTDPAMFHVQGVRIDGATVYHTNTGGAVQTLVLADSLQATFSVSAPLGDSLYTSFQALTCERI